MNQPLFFCVFVVLTVGKGLYAVFKAEFLGEMRRGGISQKLGDLKNRYVAVFKIFLCFFKPQSVSVFDRAFAKALTEDTSEIDLAHVAHFCKIGYLHRLVKMLCEIIKAGLNYLVYL